MIVGVIAGLTVAGCRQPSPPEPAAVGAVPAQQLPRTVQTIEPDPRFPVLLGIDVLEAGGFAEVRGKRIGVLSHPAGVNRSGEHTIAVLRRAPETKLVALFAPEHGLYGLEKASAHVHDTVDRATGLPVYSLHGDNRKPTVRQLQGIDAMVVDLQDIGVRSYTFNVAMRYTLDVCLQQGMEVIVLDRPNPLGGLKVSGPLLDDALRSGVGAFPVPYVHGLTMAELARFAIGTPGVLEGVTETARANARLTVVPMRGWKRSMRWPETGLKYVPTSQLVPEFDAVVGYAMVGLGCVDTGFYHGIGADHPFRTLSYSGKPAELLERDLRALRIPGVHVRALTVPDRQGKPVRTVHVAISDWEAWDPTEMSFHLMRLAARYAPSNPYAKFDAATERRFNIHVGSKSWWDALRRDGAKVDVAAWCRRWRHEARDYQMRSRFFWLYE